MSDRPKLKPARHQSLVITRRGVRRVLAWHKPLMKLASRFAPEILGTLGALLFIGATWAIHPIAGLYAAALGAVGAALVVGLGRRPGG